MSSSALSRALALLACLPALVFSAPERIVTLGGAVTETVFALGAGEEIVARDTSSVYPPAVHALPDVGYFRTLGAEGVLAQNPTLILAAQGAGPAAQIALLQNSGVRFVHLDTRPSALAVLGNITRLGEVLKREPEAAALKEKIEARLAVARSLAAPGSPAPSVVFLLGFNEGSAQAAYDDTAASALIALAGGRNALTGLAGYKAVNPEALIALDPDVILFGVNPLLPAARPPAWLAGTRAGLAGRVHPLDLGYHLSFGPRLGDAVAEVAALLHPAAENAPSALVHADRP